MSNKSHPRKLTSPYMTKYEKTRMLGVRAEQLSMGDPPMVQLAQGETDMLAIATRELKEGVMPLFLRRYFPDKTHEDWLCQDLIVDWGHDPSHR